MKVCLCFPRFLASWSKPDVNNSISLKFATYVLVLLEGKTKDVCTLLYCVDFYILYNLQYI